MEIERDMVVKGHPTRITQKSSDALDRLKEKIKKQLNYTPNINEVINFCIQVCDSKANFTNDEGKFLKMIK